SWRRSCADDGRSTKIIQRHGASISTRALSPGSMTIGALGNLPPRRAEIRSSTAASSCPRSNITLVRALSAKPKPSPCHDARPCSGPLGARLAPEALPCRIVEYGGTDLRLPGVPVRPRTDTLADPGPAVLQQRQCHRLAKRRTEAARGDAPL